MKYWQLHFVTSEPMQDYLRATRPSDESLLKTQASMSKKEASLGPSLARPHDLIGVPSLKVLTFLLACLVAIHVILERGFLLFPSGGSVVFLCYGI